MTKRDINGFVALGVLAILVMLWFSFSSEKSVSAKEYGLKEGDIITLPLGKPTRVQTSKKYRDVIFTFTGKLSKYYTIDYQKCTGEQGTSGLPFCDPHKIFFEDGRVGIDIFIFEIKECVDRCSTLILEFIQYK